VDQQTAQQPQIDTKTYLNNLSNDEKNPIASHFWTEMLDTEDGDFDEALKSFIALQRQNKTEIVTQHIDGTTSNYITHLSDKKCVEKLSNKINKTLNSLIAEVKTLQQWSSETYKKKDKHENELTEKINKIKMLKEKHDGIQTLLEALQETQPENSLKPQFDLLERLWKSFFSSYEFWWLFIMSWCSWIQDDKHRVDFTQEIKNYATVLYSKLLELWKGSISDLEFKTFLYGVKPIDDIHTKRLYGFVRYLLTHSSKPKDIERDVILFYDRQSNNGQLFNKKNIDYIADQLQEREKYLETIQWPAFYDKDTQPESDYEKYNLSVQADTIRKNDYGNNPEKIPLTIKLTSKSVDELKQMGKPVYVNVLFTIEKESIFVAKDRLATKNDHVGAINFMHQKVPGGGAVKGQALLEEDKFRITNLGISYVEYASKNGGIKRNENGTPFYSSQAQLAENEALFTKDVSIQKEIEYKRKSTDQEKNAWYCKKFKDLPQDKIKKMFVVGNAAINLREHNEEFTAQIKKAQRIRIRTHVSVAIQGFEEKDGSVAIVLSAFGCGGFKNPPAEIANLYADVLFNEGYIQFFKGGVHFAIVDEPTFKVFNTILQDRYQKYLAANKQNTASSTSSTSTSTSSTTTNKLTLQTPAPNPLPESLSSPSITPAVNNDEGSILVKENSILETELNINQNNSFDTHLTNLITKCNERQLSLQSDIDAKKIKYLTAYKISAGVNGHLQNRSLTSFDSLPKNIQQEFNSLEYIVKTQNKINCLKQIKSQSTYEKALAECHKYMQTLGDDRHNQFLSRIFRALTWAFNGCNIPKNSGAKTTWDYFKIAKTASEISGVIESNASIQQHKI
jgi:hypothetical protein